MILQGRCKQGKHWFRVLISVVVFCYAESFLFGIWEGTNHVALYVWNVKMFTVIFVGWFDL